MTLDLLHNKIIKETMTEAFEKSVNDNLVPKLYSLYGVSLEGIQMYEDYIKDEFVKDGYCYYPLTVLLGEVKRTIWIKWDVSNKQLFKNGNPYAFLGEQIDFILAEDVPFAFRNALDGKSTYYEGGYLKVNVTTDAPDIMFIAGKYSQTFIDEMARQLTGAISKACGVTGIENSSIEVDIVFAPNTYMEHTSENVTYRRLLISAKGCAPRDFWIKWTRLNSSVAYSVNDTVDRNSIVFEIGEDVSHKIREKEYRYLVHGNSDKYRVAMGRKSITEWRELIKRSIKRGELAKSMDSFEEENHVNEVSDKLSEILEKCGVTVSVLDKSVSAPSVDNTEIANEALRLAILGETEAEVTEEEDTAELSESLDTVGGEQETSADEPTFDDIKVPEFAFPDGLELTMSDTDGAEENFLLESNTVADEDEDLLGIEESDGISMIIEKPEPEDEESDAQVPDASDEHPVKEVADEDQLVEADEVGFAEEAVAEIADEIVDEVADEPTELDEKTATVDSDELERLYTEIATLRRALEEEKIRSEKLADELDSAKTRADRLDESVAHGAAVSQMLDEAKAEIEAVKLERDALMQELEFEKKHSEELLSSMEDGVQAAEELANAKLQIEKERAARGGIEKQLEFERITSQELRTQIEKDSAAIEEVRLLVNEADNAKKLAEAEANRLRAENEEVCRENRQLVEACRAAEEAAEKIAEELREREQELLTQIELSEKERSREKQLFAEAARQAKEENERIAEQAAEEERIRLAEEERIRREQAEESERLAKEEALIREKERIEREAKDRAEENARRRAEALARAQETRRRMEEAARRNAEARAVINSDYVSVDAKADEESEEVEEIAAALEPCAEESAVALNTVETADAIDDSVTEDMPEVNEPDEREPVAEDNAVEEPTAAPEAPKAYTYTSKIARLMFRSSIDPNVISRIHELVTRAISEAGKEHVYIKIKASSPDKTTVVLNFVEIPEEEHDLLVAIIRYLGNSNLGIYKVILE